MPWAIAAATVVKTLWQAHICCTSVKCSRIPPSRSLLPTKHTRHTATMAEQDILPPQCCTLAPLISEYKPVGETIYVKGKDGQQLEIYSTGPRSAKYGLLCIYDIFGMTPNTLQGADVLAKHTGYRVVVPDFFRGQAWDHTNFPPREGRPFLQAWIRKIGSWDLIKPDLLKVVEMLKADGQESLGSYGFCFGSKKLCEAEADKEAQGVFKAIAMVHPSNTLVEDANAVSVPLALLPSNGEDPEVMNGFWDIIKKKPFADKCVRKDFDAHHGFAAARADWSDPKLESIAREAYGILAKFFKANL